MMGSRCFIAIAAICGFLSVAIGAFGAHGLPDYLNEKGLESAEVIKKVANFETGAQYLMYHALAILALGVSSLPTASKMARWSVGMFLIGMLLFSGGLFVTSITDLRIHMIIPIGGVFYLIGWGILIGAACCPHCCTNNVVRDELKR